MMKNYCYFVVVAILAIFCVAENDFNAFVKPNTPANLERLRRISTDDLAEELSGQYQGDLILTAEQLREYRGSKQGKTGIKSTFYRWNDQTVPYWINETYFNSSQIEYIHLGAQKLQEVTCLKFVKYDEKKHKDYITIEGEDTGCWSFLGRTGGRQYMNLRPFEREVGCFRLYTIVHEFIHAIGFFHQQAASERDEYVKIVWDKIEAGTEFNFDAYGSNIISNFDVEYDYGSVMHYGKTAFSIDGSDTIVALKDLKGATMGQRLRLSENDIERINKMYCEEPVRRPNFLGRLVDVIREYLRNIFGNIR